MSKPKVRDLVLETLKKYDYKILEENKISEDEMYFVVEDSIIGVNEKRRNMNVQFNVAASVEDVAITVLNLKEIQDIELYVGSAFIFDDDGTYIDGIKAKELYETKKEKYIIENFVHDQSQKHFLVHSDGYKC